MTDYLIGLIAIASLLIILSIIKLRRTRARQTHKTSTKSSSKDLLPSPAPKEYREYEAQDEARKMLEMSRSPEPRRISRYENAVRAGRVSSEKIEPPITGMKKSSTREVFTNVSAQATIPRQMQPQKSYSIKMTLTGAKLAPDIQFRKEDYVETKTLKAYPRKTLTIKAQATAFRVQPQEIEVTVPQRGESTDHDFLVTPEPKYQGNQKLLFQIFQANIHLTTLNADIEIKPNPQETPRKTEITFAILEKGLLREYESGKLLPLLQQHLTIETIKMLNSKDHEEIRYLLILLLANQPPYREHGLPVKENDETRAYNKKFLNMISEEALAPLPALEFEFYRGANRVLGNRLEQTFGYARSFKDEKNFTWYYLTSKGRDNALRALENLLIKSHLNRA